MDTNVGRCLGLNHQPCEFGCLEFTSTRSTGGLCTCGHAARAHELALRACSNRQSVFETGDNSPTLTSICSICARPYHAHALLNDLSSASHAARPQFSSLPSQPPPVSSSARGVVPSYTTTSVPPTSQVLEAGSGYTSQSRAVGWHRTPSGPSPSQNNSTPIGISAAPVPAPSGSQFSPAVTGFQTSQFYRRHPENPSAESGGPRKRARFSKIQQYKVRVIVDCLAPVALAHALREEDELFNVPRTLHAPFSHFMQRWFNHASTLGIAFEYSTPAEGKNAILPVLEAQLQAHMVAHNIRVPETEAVSSLPVREDGSRTFFSVYWVKARGKNSDHTPVLHHWPPEQMTYTQLEDSSKRIADPDGYSYIIAVPRVDFFEVSSGGMLHVCYHDRLWAQSNNMGIELRDVACWTACIPNPSQLAPPPPPRTPPPGPAPISSPSPRHAQGQSPQDRHVAFLTGTPPRHNGSPVQLAAVRSFTVPPQRALELPVSEPNRPASAFSGVRTRSHVRPLTAFEPAMSPSPEPPSTPPDFDLGDLDPERPNLTRWLRELRSQQTPVASGHAMIELSADNIGDAATGLFAHLVSLANGTPAVIHGTSTLSLRNFNIAGIMAGAMSVSVGDAQGGGVVREVWSRVGGEIANALPSHFWVMDSPSAPRTVALRSPDMASHRDINSLATPVRAVLRALGLYFSFSIMLGIPPESFRPSLVMYVMTRNRHISVADSFLSLADPAMAARLRTWPPPIVHLPDGQEVFDLAVGRDRDPEVLILAHPTLSTEQLSTFRTLAATEVVQVGRELAAHLAFGAHGATIERQAVIAAICEGADMVHVEGGNSPAQLVDNFNNAMFASADNDSDMDEPLVISAIVADLFAGRTFTQASQLIERLEMRGDAGRPEAQQLWMLHLQRYLRGGAGIERAVAFLRAMTGSMFLSSEPPLDRLTIRFVRALPGRDGVLTAAHTCFAEVDVLFNDTIEEMVNRTVEQDLSIQSDFDSYMDAFCAETGDADLNIM